MKETLLFLATPIAASILLAGVLGYFGTHILPGVLFSLILPLPRLLRLEP